MLMRSYLAVSLSVLFLFVAVAQADQPDCTDLGCHELAYCEFNASSSSVCVCPPGTIDKSGGDGEDCATTGWRVRYVIDSDPGDNPSADITDAEGFAKCDAGAEGYFVNKVRGMEEVSCLYSNKPTDISMYDELFDYVTEPAVYSWTLPTTGEALQIPPTGMTVNSVQFETSCAETGCWVIRGVMTTGEAFNTNGAFNTFYLPEASIVDVSPTGDLSYDYDYSAVEWTFQNSLHPCTSAAYMAGSSGTEEISTCCITNPTVGNTGGFVANYRPTEAFVDWAGDLKCSVVFERDGVQKCWKFYREIAEWGEAATRCGNAGGKLATIASQAENDLFRGYFTSAPELYERHVWINLERNDDGSFSWGDGSDYPMQTWASWFNSYSNQSDPEYEDFDCVKMRNDRNGVWINRPCTENNAFMCEFTPPTYDDTCVQHVIQRPEYTAPTPSRSCWNYVEPSVKHTWESANATCVEMGGTLAVIRDNEENWFMRRFLDWKSQPHTFLAFNDIDGDGTWSMPGDYTYDNWADASQPNKNARRCARMTGNAIWTSFECTKPSGQGAVCELPREANPTCDSDLLQNEDNGWDETYPAQPLSFLDVGKFKGMNASPGVTNLTNLDPFFGQYFFEIKLDEVELRSRAGKLKGTVGVEHTVDTFLGLANFRPTGLKILDTFATQTNIHLEKTSFFSVSTHGVNEYTFLEYVNMRLVQILDEDADFSGDAVDTNGNGDDEAADRTVRTDTAGNAAYVQVTFTMGPQYQPNMQSGGLIPLDSVRAGMGTFFDEVNAAGKLEHLCQEYDDATDNEAIGLTYDGGSGNSRGEKGTYNLLVGQPCGPQASMCASPDTVPDQFVSFNIPLGFEVFDGQASNDLSNNIFVDFVVNAVDTDAKDNDANPNAGQRPWQMKTTLSASIPIVAGGLNIFCDGFTAKTDLKDVANVDIVVGTANSPAELTRLRILEDVASTVLATKAPSQINTDSIESALMTLVIKGNESYFTGSGRNTVDYTMELDDVITLHMMEDGVAQTSSKEAAVQALLDTPGADNSDSNGIDTDGYSLNGAFYFTVNRVAGTASLEPSTSLLSHCPFNPPRPVDGNQLETCVTRRDVKLRDYPTRAGAVATAMEILASADPKESSKSAIDTMAEALDETSDESTFLTTILGASDYTKDLAPDFVRAIHDRYELNGRFRRAYWINPGYEWTPTQTAGKSLFSVSQKIYLFALISLDENWTRRRMLLQASSQDAMSEAGAGMGQAAMQFKVTPKSMMASAFGVHEDFVAAYDVELQLTRAEACMLPTQRQSAVRSTLEGYLATAASKHHTVQVTKMSVDLGDELCDSRRALRKLHATFSSATASIRMLIVFSEDETPKFNVEAFAKSAGINSATAAADSSLPPSLEDRTYIKIDEDEDEDEDSSSMPMTLIAGVCGGVGAVVVMVAGVILYRRSKRESEPEVVQCISLEDIKGELSFDNGAVCHQSSFEGEASSWDKALAAS